MVVVPSLKIVVVVIGLGVLQIAIPQAAWSGSVLELLNGFAEPADLLPAADLDKRDAEKNGIAGRVLFQLQRAGTPAVRSRRFSASEIKGYRWQPGDAIVLTGEATLQDRYPLSETLRDVLGISGISRYDLRVESIPAGQFPEGGSDLKAGREVQVLTNQMLRSWLQDAKIPHRVGLTGIVIATDSAGQPTVVATSAFEWFPLENEPVPVAGWHRLAALGVDCSLLEPLRRNDKQPLQAEEPFYQLLAATARQDADVAAGKSVKPIDLLRDSSGYVGEWIRLKVETVRVTKIFLDNKNPQEAAVGTDHYWQIDAIGKVDGKVLVESLPQEDGTIPPPIEFSGRYPVSLVVLELPPELHKEVDQTAGQEATVAMVRRQVLLDGFYYRQWSYDTEFMRSRGGGQQFGPLVIVSKMKVLDSPLANQGRSWQGIVAGCFLLGLAAIIAITWWTARKDREIARQRHLEYQDLDFNLASPDEKSGPMRPSGPT
ncbi:hypothetical protein FF011L_40240 [Roseimaritima multifibrata]|uniref:Uncharacterized protein n=1 Tax=Roseimaritima multifibrata TaxID=1930274 RepID=A0A517MK08_9BACT|nr:hypothetical protein FF011L_40240 [Roseimaritima multifibrata]